MNRNLQFAIAAAIASLGVTGQAHALTQSTASTSGSLFLYVFEDRVGSEPEANPLATNSAVFDLGMASAFNANANNSWNFSNDSAWTSYVSTIANPANIHWGVFGTTTGVGGSGTTLLMTKSVDNALNGAATFAMTSKANSLMTVYGASCTTCGFNVQTTGDAASGQWDDSAGATVSSVLTAGLGQSMNFYQHVSTGTKSTNMSNETAFAFGGDADYFTLGSNGMLSYTAAAPVPEADSYAMMLAGLGLVGFMVYRRKLA